MSNSLCRFQYGAIRIMAGRRTHYHLGIDEAILTGVLDFSFQKIGDEGATALGEALQHNTTLRELNLEGNTIGAEGATALGLTLRHNATLTKLVLGFNNIGDGGATALGLALQLNTTLTDLNLGENNIGDEGAGALGLALQHNTTLRELNLEGNTIGAEGATALWVALQHNTTLMILNLEENNIDGNNSGDDILASIANKINRNKVLFCNQYWSPCVHVDFPEPFHKIIIATLLCNRSTGNYPTLPDHVWHFIFSFWQRQMGEGIE